MRWSRVTALSRLDQGGDPTQGSAAVSIIVLPSPTEFQRSGETQRSRLGYTIAIAGALVAALVVFRLAAITIPYVAGLLPAQTSQNGKPSPAPKPAAQAAQVAAAAGGQARAAPSSTPTPAPVSAAAPSATGSVATAATSPVATAPTGRTAPPATPAATALVGATAGAKQERVHTVQRGDTLYSIAQRNGTTVDALVAANKLGGSATVLSIGQQLTIP